MNEVDALANIDFNTREEKEKLRQLEIVRIGTCGGLAARNAGGHIHLLREIGGIRRTPQLLRRT